MPGDALARMRGIPNIPSITEINIRGGASTDNDLLFKVPVGMSGQRILDVAQDTGKARRDEKIYQWFKLQFDGGAVGWVRDDLIEIQGDCTKFGYPDLSEPTFAFALTHNPDLASNDNSEEASIPVSAPDPVAPKVTGTVWKAPGPTTEPVMTPVLASGDFPTAKDDLERLRTLAFRFTASWEGGFSAINNYDSGIVSYGFLQFTLAGGSLISLIQNYLNKSQSETAEGLRKMLPRIEARDELLRDDRNFLDLLRDAADEQEMIDAQYEIGTNGYWQQVVDGYIVSRDLQYPLTWALLFDMGVNFGVNHGFVRLAERDLGVPSRSNPALSGLGEEQLVTYIIQLRKRSHDRQAASTGFVGLANRGNFWMKLATDGDWYLQGGATGNFVSNGHTISAKNP
ncbi:MAG: hypothetical protein Phog2KO_45820 [Phototrophicaceae bacterium]